MKPDIDLPMRTEREAKIEEIKSRINALYLKLKLNQSEFSVLSREYTTLLKELELLIIQVNF